jgi:hypothetical protein
MMFPIHPEQVKPRPDIVGEIGCQTGTEKFALMSENSGYIFRNPKRMQYGHSGYHDTKRRACRSAFAAAETKCFQFSTKEELVTWLNEP